MLRRDFELRSAEVGGDGRTVVLACVPFDVVRRVDDGQGPYREGFRRGAFRHVRKAANRVELRYNHQADGPPYGFGVDLVEEADRLLGHFRVAPSAQGDQVLALVRDGQLAGVSVGFIPGTDDVDVDEDGPVVWRTKVAQLSEVSLTTAAAYPEARVLAVRSAPPVDVVAQARARWALERLRFTL